MAKYIRQFPTRPQFTIGYENLLPQLSRCHVLQGQLFQQLPSLGILPIWTTRAF